MVGRWINVWVVVHKFLGEYLRDVPRFGMVYCVSTPLVFIGGGREDGASDDRTGLVLHVYRRLSFMGRFAMGVIVIVALYIHDEVTVVFIIKV